MRDLLWALLPSFVLPYTGLLVATVGLTVVRAGRLSWRLFGGLPRRRIPLDRVLDGSVSADELARAALANRVSPQALSQERLARLRAAPRVDNDAALRTLRAADARFDYRWRRLTIGVSSTRSLMRLTLIAAAFITTYGFFPSWEYHTYDNATESTIVAGLPASVVKALYDAGQDTLSRLTVGFAVAGGLCVVAMVFDGLLQRRLATWKYFYATARDACSDGRDGQPLE